MDKRGDEEISLSALFISIVDLPWFVDDWGNIAFYFDLLYQVEL